MGNGAIACCGREDGRETGGADSALTVKRGGRNVVAGLGGGGKEGWGYEMVLVGRESNVESWWGVLRRVM
jgi:hypothetical protein